MRITKNGLLRSGAALLVAGLVALAAIKGTGWGTLCSFGEGGLSFTCPLGFLQLAAASRSALPQLWISTGLAIAIVVLLGRAFCGWVCPASMVHPDGRGPGVMNATETGPEESAGQTDSFPAGLANDAYSEVGARRSHWRRDSAVAVLIGSLLSSFVFGFPVFCLVCPVGLFFGAVFAVVRLFSAKQASLELLLCPALFAVEVLFLRSWCQSLCPLGALLTIIGRFAPLGRPLIKRDKCLAARGAHCRVCKSACPEGIDLLRESGEMPVSECTRCLECYEKCPTGAIALWPFRAPRGRAARRVARPTGAAKR